MATDTWNEEKQANLSAAFNEMLLHIAGLGWEMPVRFVALGRNGAVMAGYFQEGQGGSWVPTFTVSHVPDGAVRAPVNIMWTDGTGREAVRAYLGPEHVITYH